MKTDLFAIIEAAGRQVRVEPNQLLDMEGVRLEKDSKEIVFNKVLAVRKGESFEVGTPYVQGASVSCEFLEELRGPKKVIFKIRRRKNYRRKKGYRATLAKLRVKEINF